MDTTQVALVTSFFGWCTIFNVSLLTLSTISICLMKEQITVLHNKLFGVKETNLLLAYFKYLAYYKLAIIVFNIVPYISLKIII